MADGRRLERRLLHARAGDEAVDRDVPLFTADYAFWRSPDPGPDAAAESGPRRKGDTDTRGDEAFG